MGLMNSIFKNEKHDYVVNSPMKGKIKALSTLNDGVFSDKLLGEGIVIESECEDILAPFDGSVVMTTSTNHAIGLYSDEGVEVLIHIGIDTVMMEGNGFTNYVRKDEEIKKGQKLIQFSKAEIQKAGYSDDVIVIVSNTNEFASVVCEQDKHIESGDLIITIKK